MSRPPQAPPAARRDPPTRASRLARAPREAGASYSFLEYQSYISKQRHTVQRVKHDRKTTKARIQKQSAVRKCHVHIFSRNNQHVTSHARASASRQRHLRAASYAPSSRYCTVLEAQRPNPHVAHTCACTCYSTPSLPPHSISPLQGSQRPTWATVTRGIPHGRT